MAPCGPFSGGEKARLALALIVWRKPDVLLLDEPTNHLDLEMREALTLALNEYEGAVVLVSHDRHLLRATVDELYLVADGRVQPFEGDLDDYRDWLAQQRIANQPQDGGAREQRREARALAQAERQTLLSQRRPLQKELEKLERNLSNWQSERTLLETRLADPTLYQAGNPANADTLVALNKRQAELANSIDEAELRWLQLQEALENIAAQLAE